MRRQTTACKAMNTDCGWRTTWRFKVSRTPCWRRATARPTRTRESNNLAYDPKRALELLRIGSGRADATFRERDETIPHQCFRRSPRRRGDVKHGPQAGTRIVGMRWSTIRVRTSWSRWRTNTSPNTSECLAGQSTSERLENAPSRQDSDHDQIFRWPPRSCLKWTWHHSCPYFLGLGLSSQRNCSLRHQCLSNGHLLQLEATSRVISLSIFFSIKYLACYYCGSYF